MNKLQDNGIWDNPKFLKLEPRYMLIERFMFERLADKCGIVFFDRDFMEFKFRLKLDSQEEISEKLKDFWVDCGGSKYLRKDYLDETQGGKLYLYLPVHRVIFEDIANHYKDGYKAVVGDIRKANPKLEVQTMSEAKSWINGLKDRLRLNPKEKGHLANITAFEKTERYFNFMKIEDFPPMNEGFDDAEY
jgi:hypothetical protein